jgi:hypothetical protein
MSEKDIERLQSIKFIPTEDTGGEWKDVFTATEVSKPWEPIEPKEGNKLFIQNGQGKFIEYIYEDGRYRLVGTVDG